MKDKVRELIIAGKKTKEIAEEVGKSVQWIREIIRNEGWKSLPKGRDAEIVKMLEAGVSAANIAKKFKMTPNGVRMIKKKFSVKSPKKNKVKKMVHMEWAVNKHKDVPGIAKKVQKKLLKNGVDIWICDIEGEMSDCVVEAACNPNAKNLSSYFNGIVRNRITVMIDRHIREEMISIDDDDYSEELEQCIIDTRDPEILLLLKEEHEDR